MTTQIGVGERQLVVATLSRAMFQHVARMKRSHALTWLVTEGRLVKGGERVPLTSPERTRIPTLVTARSPDASRPARFSYLRA
jgi:hypothetical protein